MTTIYSLKTSLQRSVQVFAIAIIFSTVILFTSIYFGTDKWIMGLLPTIILLSVIGEFALARAIVRLSSMTGSIEGEKDEEFENRFNGISGLNGLLYATVPLVYCAVYISLYSLKINILDFKIVNLWVSLSLLGLTAYFLYRTINQLSFILMFISIIYGWTDTARAMKVNEKIKDIAFPEGVDLAQTYKKMAVKYTQRIEWMESHMNDENKTEYKHKISIYQNVLRDIEDIVNGIVS